jgi:hypothetical protein
MTQAPNRRRALVIIAVLVGFGIVALWRVTQNESHLVVQVGTNGIARVWGIPFSNKSALRILMRTLRFTGRPVTIEVPRYGGSPRLVGTMSNLFVVGVSNMQIKIIGPVIEQPSPFE